MIALGVFTFFALNIDTVLGAHRYSPLLYQVLLFVGVLATVFSRGKSAEALSVRALLSNPLMIWGVAYLCLCGLSLGLAYDSVSAMEGFRYAVSTALIIGAAVVAFSTVNGTSAARLGNAALAVLVVVCISLYLDPIMDFRARLGMLASAYDRTRAGGVFLQPNLAGAAVPFVLAAVVSRVRPGVALASVGLSLGAVVLTFSREGLLLMALVITLAFVRGYLPRVSSLAAILACATLLAGSQISSVVQTVFHVNQGDGLARMNDAAAYMSGSALSSDSRVDIARLAFDDVLRAPISGRGVGYSWYWGRAEPNEVGTHDIYLRHMLEYGLLGALIWPLFLWALYRVRFRTLDRAWVAGLLAVAFIAGFFSHDLTEQGVFLIPLIAAISLPAPIRMSHRGQQVAP